MKFVLALVSALTVLALPRDRPPFTNLPIGPGPDPLPMPVDNGPFGDPNVNTPWD